MQKTKSKITIGLTAIYCAAISAGVIWQNVELDSAELEADILTAEKTNSTTVRRIAANSNNITNLGTAPNEPTTIMMSSETRSKIRDGAETINESTQDLKEIMGEAEWCMNNEAECALEKIDLPPMIQEMANTVKEAEEYSKYMQAIPMLVQSEIGAVQSEIQAEIARMRFLAKNEVPMTDDTLDNLNNLKNKVGDAKETAAAATEQLKNACGENCEIDDEVAESSSNEVAMRKIPTTNNSRKKIPSPTVIAKISNENKTVASISKKNNSLLSASILSASPTKNTPTSDTTAVKNTSRKVAIVTTSNPKIGSEYAEILAQLDGLETELDDVGGNLNELAEKTSEKIAENNEKLEDDLKKEVEKNAEKLAEAKAAAKKAEDEWEPPEDNKQPTAIGFSNLDKNGNKIYSEYDDVIPIRPSSGLTLPTWNYNEQVYTPPAAQ